LSAVQLSYVSIFTRDVETLPDFYAEAFGLAEIETSRSHRYRELSLGPLKLGFPFVDAYAALDMADQAEPTGVRSMLTFAAADPAAVDALTALAVQRGARLVKPGFTTGFGQYLSVILDPEGNAVRISAPA
jgi:hypothetical protein